MAKSVASTPIRTAVIRRGADASPESAWNADRGVAVMAGLELRSDRATRGGSGAATGAALRRRDRGRRGRAPDEGRAGIGGAGGRKVGVFRGRLGRDARQRDAGLVLDLHQQRTGRGPGEEAHVEPMRTKMSCAKAGASRSGIRPCGAGRRT